MFSSIAEGFIQKLCGKYLKNFSSENVSIGVTGIITIKDIQVKTDELVDFQLPYKPASIFIGTLYADLPFVSGGNFDVKMSDVLIVVEKRGENLAELHPYEVQRALQMWIGAFYLNLANLSEMKATQSISSTEIEYVQKLIDRLCVTVDNVHFRMEEMFTAHIPCPIGEDSLCLGTMVSKIELRPPTSTELTEKKDGKYLWNVDGDTRTTRVINKLMKCTNISIYCSREECVAAVSGPQLNTAFVREKAWNRDQGKIVGPVNLTSRFSGAYQRTNLVFGPVSLNITLDGLDFHATDEQISFLAGVIVSFETHAHRYTPPYTASYTPPYTASHTSPDFFASDVISYILCNLLEILSDQLRSMRICNCLVLNLLSLFICLSLISLVLNVDFLLLAPFSSPLLLSPCLLPLTFFSLLLLLLFAYFFISGFKCKLV